MSATLPAVPPLAAITVSLTEADVRTVLRAFLLDVLPAGVEVVRGQDNRVAEPEADDYVVLTVISRERIATNSDAYVDTPGAGHRLVTQPTQITIQLDVHGPNSPQNVQVAATLLRDAFACDWFAASPYDVQPLYAGEPRQMPFIDAEGQYEDRWTVDAVLQANVVVATPQQFAGAVTATPAPADLSAIRLSATATTP